MTTANQENPSQNEEKFAIWLKPENEVYQVLKRIIDSLSAEYDAPRFEPHITVAGNIRSSTESVEKMIKTVAEKSEPMTLYLTETGYRDNLYQSFFIHIAPNDALLALRERCLAKLGLEHNPYMPHISLLYKEIDSEEKKQIMERIGRRFDLVFIPDKLYLVRTSGSPETWEEVMQTSLIK